jgi:hypothetical protein
MSDVARLARRGKAQPLALRLADIEARKDHFLVVGDLTKAVLNCHPNSAHIILEFLKNVSATNSHPSVFYYRVIEHAIGPARQVKAMLVLDMAGFERPGIIQMPTPLSAELMGKVDAMRSSFHGQLELLNLEPDDEAILSRPWWKPFYGMPTSRFRGDAAIWQRWCLPVLLKIPGSRLVKFSREASFLLALAVLYAVIGGVGAVIVLTAKQYFS